MNIDNSRNIEAGKIFPVCGNGWTMLAEMRFARHFDDIGDSLRHFGIFAGCGTSLSFGTATPGAAPPGAATPGAATPGAATARCC